MKKLLFLFAVAFTHFSTYAAVIIVSNNPNVPGQFTSLQAAIDAATPDDTLYVQGSTTSYGNVTLYKKLTLIGGGAMPNISLSLPSQIGDIYIRYSDDGTSNGSGSAIYGCKIYSIVFGYKLVNTTYLTVGNITISRNSIGGISNANTGYIQDINFPGINISNNYIGTVYIDRLGGNSIIKNNIIENGIQTTGYMNCGNWVAMNNVIHYRVSGCTNGVFINNIIYAYDGLGSASLSYCDFTKNIFYTPSTTQFDPNFLSLYNLNNNHNTTSGNIINQNPNFVHYAPNEYIGGYTTSYPGAGPFIDYHLNNDSPGKNYGTDGTDIGIYGGTTPFVEGATSDSRYRYFPMPAMPQMLDLTITNPSIPANGTLNVNFTAEKKN